MLVDRRDNIVEVLVLGIDNSLIPVEIGTCNEYTNVCICFAAKHNQHTGTLTNFIGPAQIGIHF